MATFKSAFEGKREILTEKLEVSDDLLRKLNDAKILESRHFDDIIDIRRNCNRVDKLLEILKMRDDKLLHEFCNILDQSGQQHVVDILMPELRHVSGELYEIVEPFYGLELKLYEKEIISEANFEHICDEKKRDNVSQVAAYLLFCVLQKLKSFKDRKFVHALRKSNQLHVANFVKYDGNIGLECGDLRPLNVQQRRRLLCITTKRLRKDTDFRKTNLLELLLRKEVISDAQQEDVERSGKTRSESNGILLRILKRRSLKDVKNFFSALEEVGQNGAVEVFTEPYSIAQIRTKILGFTENDEEVERRFIENFNNQTKTVGTSDIEILRVEQRASLAWYIVCRTPESVESLRKEYIDGNLAAYLQRVFDSACESEAYKLQVNWGYEDFEDCKKLFDTHSGMPFGTYAFHVRSEKYLVTIFR